MTRSVPDTPEWQFPNRAAVECLLAPLLPDSGRDGGALPDLARRLTALAGAVHRKMRRSGYPVADTLIDRPPMDRLVLPLTLKRIP